MSETTNKPAMLCAYLIVGEDELKRRTVIERLRKRVESFGDLEFNHDFFNGEICTGAEIVDACNTLPFASEMRLVEVANIDKLKKADAEALIDYLENPNGSTILALIGEKLAKNTRLYKAVAGVGAKAVIDCAPMKRQDLPTAVRSMAVGHGITLSGSAATLLIELVGEDTVALDSQLRKLALAHAGNAAVGEKEVEALVERTAEAKPWEFVDAFSSRNAKRCLELRKKLPGTSSYALLAMCATRLRELICAQSLIARGQQGMLAQALGVPSWRVKNHATWARGFKPGSLEAALIATRDVEQRMKSGSDPEEAFMAWVLETIR